MLPAHVPEQIAAYQTNALMTHAVCAFDPIGAAAAMQAPRRALAIDIGGDKLRSAVIETCGGRLIRTDERTVRSRGGAGFLNVLERLSVEATAAGMPVGISSATRLDGSVVTRTVNLPHLFADLRQHHGADYARLFPTAAFVVNDTVAGLCGATAHLVLRGALFGEIGFCICASGLGAAVLDGGTAVHVEIGHVPLVDALNPLGQTMPCGVEGRAFVCVERVTAARAGIENLYHRITGKALDGVELGQLYEAGDELATRLYEGSAAALAHAMAGVAERYGFTRDATFVLHGGNFEIPRYRDEIQRRLDALPGHAAGVVFSRNLSPNACLEGAAIGALWRTAPNAETW